MHRILVLFLLALGTISLPAQAPSSATLRVDTQIVLLDVAVTDANGKPVLDLRPDEFRITEKNVPQAIASFEAPSAHTLPAADAGKVIVNSTGDLAKIGGAPVTLLVLDELNMGLFDRSFACTRTIEWLKRQPAVLPQPTALLAINDRNLHLLRDYTQDRTALLEVLNKHAGDVQWRQAPDADSASTQENMGAVLGALEELAQATRGIPGRKNILWVGIGFPSVAVSDVGLTDADAVGANLRYLSNLMMQARVTFSVIGPSLSASEANLFNSTLAQGGTQTLADQTQTGANLSAFDNGNGVLKFAQLATSSGGHNYTARNDIDAEIERSVDEGAAYYTISYRPTDRSNDPRVYRRIRVTVTRPALTVQTRDGYYQQQQRASASGANSKDSTKQIAFEVNNAASSTLAFTDLHIAAERAGPSQFTLHATARDLGWRDLPDGRRHADVVLMAACLNAKGKLLAKSFATLGSNTDATLASIGISTAALPMRVVAPAGTARIRFVVCDVANGRIGTVDVAP
jgi:VWFA-related protein